MKRWLKSCAKGVQSFNNDNYKMLHVHDVIVCKWILYKATCITIFEELFNTKAFVSHNHVVIWSFSTTQIFSNEVLLKIICIELNLKRVILNKTN